jgi:hypothetical protein
MFEGFLVIGRLQMPREITFMSIVGSKINTRRSATGTEKRI